MDRLILKTVPRLEGPLPRWLPHMAVSRRPQLPHGAPPLIAALPPPPQRVIPERESRQEPHVFYDLPWAVSFHHWILLSLHIPFARTTSLNPAHTQGEGESGCFERRNFQTYRRVQPSHEGYSVACPLPGATCPSNSCQVLENSRNFLYRNKHI